MMHGATASHRRGMGHHERSRPGDLGRVARRSTAGYLGIAALVVTDGGVGFASANTSAVGQPVALGALLDQELRAARARGS